VTLVLTGTGGQIRVNDSVSVHALA
jgi:hypothetical protein